MTSTAPPPEQETEPAPARAMKAAEVVPGRLDLRMRLSGTSPKGNAEHVVLVGASQSGKSTAAYNIARGLRNLVVIDFARKGQFDALGVVSEDPDAILRNAVVIFQPPPAAVARPAKDYSDPWSRALHHINTVRRRAGVTVLHDEPRRTLPTNPHPYAAQQIDLGAGQGIGVIVATQGYSRVYPPAFDNAVHWLLFRVASASQRGSLESSLDVQVPGWGEMPAREFYYWRQGQATVSGPHALATLGPRPPR